MISKDSEFTSNNSIVHRTTETVDIIISKIQCVPQISDKKVEISRNGNNKCANANPNPIAKSTNKLSGGMVFLKIAGLRPESYQEYVKWCALQKQESEREEIFGTTTIIDRVERHC